MAQNRSPMTSIHRKFRALRAPGGRRRTPVRPHGRVMVAAAFGAFWLIAILAIAPSPPTAEYQLATYIAENAQSLEVTADPTLDDVARDDYTASPGSRPSSREAPTTTGRRW